MAQHDYVIANDTAANVRADINSALAAIASNNSGATAPATTYANQWWYDTSTDTLKIRSEADDAWISVGVLDQTNDVFSLISSVVTIVGGTQNWTVTASGTNLTFAYNGTNKMRIDSSGNLTVVGNVTAYGTL